MHVNYGRYASDYSANELRDNLEYQQAVSSLRKVIQGSLSLAEQQQLLEDLGDIAGRAAAGNHSEVADHEAMFAQCLGSSLGDGYPRLKPLLLHFLELMELITTGKSPCNG